MKRYRYLFTAKIKDGEENVYWNEFGKLTTVSGKESRYVTESPHGKIYHYYIHQILQTIDRESVCLIKDRGNTELFIKNMEKYVESERKRMQCNSSTISV